MPSKNRATEIVAQLTSGTQSPASAGELLALTYQELHRLAAAYMRGERANHTLQPTALLNEAYIKLVDRKSIDWTGEQHFVGVAAQAMRRILIDHARGHGRAKRGGGWEQVSLGVALAQNQGELDREQLLTLDAAIDRLAALDARQARLVEMRFFGGLSVEEVATVLGVSKRTAETDWAHARVWLKRELSRDGARD